MHLLYSFIREKVDRVLLDRYVDLDIQRVDLVFLVKADKHKLKLIRFSDHLIVEGVGLEGVQTGRDFIKEFLAVECLFAFVEGPGIGHFTLADERGLVFFHEVKEMTLYFEESRPQIGFQEVFYAFELHLMHVVVESLICVSHIVLYLTFLQRNELYYSWNQGMLIGQNLG